MNQTLQNYEILFTEISKLYKNTKDSMLKAYWKTGRYIIETEEEQVTDSGYGKRLIEKLSSDLTKKYGKGFSETNIKNMRRFYKVYKKSQPTAELEWSKYVILLSIKDEKERRALEKQAIEFIEQ